MQQPKTYLFLLFVITILCPGVSLAQAPEKSFSEKIEGIRVSEKELTKNASTDNSSIGQGGAMTTSVPLVTITSRTLSFPLQLNYSAGIKVDQKSGPVGLGWAMPVGSIVRDYGAFEPDYTSTKGELEMLNSNGGTPGWLNPSGSSINPSTHNEVLGHGTTVDVANTTMPISDEYHLSIPGFGGNTFWNGGNIGAVHDWKWSDFQRWRVEHTSHTFEIDQEYSRINEFNRFDCQNCDDKDHFGTDGSYAAAIGVLPYVENGYATLPSGIPSSPAKVKYEDFETFTITDDNGVVYVFGRPLRGQKFVFSDNPYWSTSANTAYYNQVLTDGQGNIISSPPDNSPKGSFWKIDFIAEWLLTEIHSPDYVDVNGNGIADDEDEGDWIRFEYTDPTQTVLSVPKGNGLPYESGGALSTTVPKHREWSSFSQTDQASSLMRERAYLTKIITPLQEVDLTISQRMDIDHDFLDKPANKKGNIFYYEDRKCSSSGTTGSVNDFDIKYPVETMKYDSIKVYSRLIDSKNYPLENILTGAIVLQYADKGSPEELAVSDYTLRNNDNTAKLNPNGTHLGTPTIQTDEDDKFNIERCNYGDKRGKTTLLAVDFLGGDLNENERTSYMFEYGFNPSFNEIHKREIIRKWTRPNIRKSGYAEAEENFKATVEFDYQELELNADGVSYDLVSHIDLHPSDFLIDVPYEENRYYYDPSTLTEYEINYFITNGVEYPATAPYEVLIDAEDHFLSPVKDQYGFYYSENYSNASEAWSLTNITYPSGGIVSFDYEPAPYDPSADEAHWSFKEDEIPLIKEYNALAKKRALSQSIYNAYSAPAYAGTYYEHKAKKLTATIEMSLPPFYGIRLKKKTMDDRVNLPVVIEYDYGTSHFTSLPAEYLSTYLGVYNNFLIREDLRHQWERNFYENSLVYDDVTNQPTGFVNDFKKNMSRVGVSNLTLDDYRATFFHEFVDTRLIDDSYTRNHYTTFSGDINDAYDNLYFVQAIRSASGVKNDRFALGGRPTRGRPIAMTKREMFDATEVLPYQVETWEYEHQIIDSRELSFDYSGFSGGGNVFYVWKDDDGFENWVPIKDDGVTPQSIAFLFDVGPFTSPNDQVTGWVNLAGTVNGYSFVFDADHLINESMTIFEYPGLYMKWNTTKSLLLKHEKNYKGLVTTNEFVYDPNEFYLTQEKVNGSYTEEKYITVYEYANETYGPNNLFIQKNILNAPTRVNKYLDLDPNADHIFSQNAFSAIATTYDVTNHSIPRVLNVYQFETDVLNSSTGTFNLVDFDFNSANNPNWRITQNEQLDYNRTGEIISSRKNRLYTKTVFGNNLNIPKAAISSPIEEFDATYSGFEDFYGLHSILDWNNEDYKKEIWFLDGEVSLDEPATSWRVPDNPCSNTLPATQQPYIKELNHVLINNVTGLQAGDQVRIELIGSSHAIPSGYVFEIETTVSDIVLLTSPIDGMDYALCVSDPIIFPEEDGTSSAIGEPYGSPSGVIIEVDETADWTIEETIVTNLKGEYNLSKTYARTGKYSYKLPTIREQGGTPNKTAVRPIKLEAPSPAFACLDPYVAPLAINQCQWSYEASVWLKYDSDVTSIGVGDGVVLKSADNQGDAKYQRGDVSESDNQQGVKIICDVYNFDHTVLLERKEFYPDALSDNWKQYTVNMPVSKGGIKWLDVYVQNEREQIGVSVTEHKSLFADDIIIYPTGSKYSYTTYDKFGNETYVTNNNDVFTESVFDEKGRPILQKNAYGTMVSEQEYFENPNWSNQNNHVTERAWVANGIYNETRYYLDGFGKTKQVMISDLARNARIVSESNYFNEKGFVTASFKPYALIGSTLEDRYDTDFIFNVQDMYSSSNALTEVTYETKPEMRVSTMSPPRENSESPIVASQQDYVTISALTAPYGTTSATQSYPAGSLLVHELTDANGNVTKTYMDNLGRVIMEEHPIGEDHIQNADGSITMTTGNAVAQTWFVYDPEGRLIKVVDPSGKESTYEYNSLGVVTKKSTVDKGTSELRYDKYGQIRFIRDQKDIDATTSNTFNTDQFAFWKYDEWGRIIETGQKQAAPSQPVFTGQLYFDDYSKIDDQAFPLVSDPLVEIHQSFKYDGSRDLFNSDVVLCETVYHDHTVNGDLTIIALTQDEKCYDYMADGQIATVHYNYQGLDEHTISYTYNNVRIPIGKRYSHPTESGYDFEWRTNLDNFARPQTNVSIWNGVQTQTGQYYYDVLGNLLAKGLGATGNTADPHLDYQFYRFDIRDQLTHNTSKHFRFGLKHDPQGNITDQYWSNEMFDPTTGANVDINQYHYYYDDMNRLIGADYLSGTMTENAFADFDQLFGNIPNDFLCGVNSIAVDEYMEPVIFEFEQNIENGTNPDESTEALNGLNILIAEYKQMDIAYSQMSESENESFLNAYIRKMNRGNVDSKAYELYRADQEGDTDHIDFVKDEDVPMSPVKLKYTKILMSGVPYSASVQCDPNENATVYGFLPTFPYPTTVTNLPKYDAAYWYTENGNITDLNRNDEGGVKTEQGYSYNASNNQLSTVDWNQQGVPSETHAMSYDANGNILNEMFVGTAPQNSISEGSPDGSFMYDDYDELPTSITIDGQTRNYRYDNNGQRIVKEVDANDKNYYLDGVVIDQNNEVISYQTPEGYVTVSSDVGTGLLISDYFYNVSDWLGTNRAIMDANGNILNAHDHYPFGKRMPGRHMVTDAEGNRYQYTGHEFDEETGYGYHGARYYNRELGRYMNVDPLAEQFHSWSTYNYTMGNPINLIDPTGMGPEDIGIYTVDKMGNVKHIKTVESNEEYDMLYRADDWESKEYYGNRISLQDQGFLAGLLESSVPAADNKKDLFVLFEFMSQNTVIEWGASGYKNGNEPTKYVIKKGNLVEVSNSALADATYGVTNKTFNLHSHPLPYGIYSRDNSNRPSGGDIDHMRKQKEAFEKANKKLPDYFYVLNASTKTLFRYNTAGENGTYIGIGQVNSWKDLNRLVK
ncbi:MAG: hypothetical protein HWE22_13635 [Flavobacteriales bacterium]|nr:hypothetical protein [Flavobacteriales bacterium]